MSSKLTPAQVVTFGSLDWSRARSRTSTLGIRHVDRGRLNLFHLALRTFENQLKIKDENTFYVMTSPLRGLIAENIACGKDWHAGFYKLMSSKRMADAISYEKRGLSTMISEMQWSSEIDRLLVEAVHGALRNRYGALAKRAKEKGEAINFSREFERIRSSLMRVKNAELMRAELADLFARGGQNRTLQQNWAKILKLFTGPDWQKARDLALLALASYGGQGTEAVDTELSESE